MEKYYRVKEDTFMWAKGAIIKHNSSKGSDGGYEHIDSIFESVPLAGEYISERIIEHPDNAKYFERVYKVDFATKTVYELKDAAKELITKGFKDK